MSNLTKERYIPAGMIEYTPEITSYPTDLFACYVNLEKLTAIFYARKSNKPVFYNRFRTVDDMKKKINNNISALMAHEDRKTARKIERKQPHTLKVGDILYTSWGYEQTNVDYYQVVEVAGEHTVKICQIKKTIERTEAYCDYLLPVRNSFIGKTETKRVQLGNYIRIASYANAWVWDGKAKYQTALGFGH